MLIGNCFECKVKLEKQIEGNDLPQKVTEPYIVDALNFTEAEARIIEEVAPYASGEVNVVDIKRARYAELFTSEAENAQYWYKVKCEFISYDEKTQKEKKTSQTMLVQAGSVQDAIDNFRNGMKGSMADFEIVSVIRTNILDVFLYSAREDKKNDKPEFEQG